MKLVRESVANTTTLSNSPLVSFFTIYRKDVVKLIIILIGMTNQCLIKALVKKSQTESFKLKHY